MLEIKTEQSRNRWHLEIVELAAEKFHLSLFETHPDERVNQSWCKRPFPSFKKALNFGARFVDVIRSHDFIYEYNDETIVHAYEKHFIFVEPEYMVVARNWVVELYCLATDITLTLYDPWGKTYDLSYPENEPFSIEQGQRVAIAFIQEIENNRLVIPGQLALPL